jgi:Fe2+ transport system protein FeoA
MHKQVTKLLLYSMMKLRELRAGESARIHSIQDSDLFLKLLEMGCVPGELIRVEKIAPFGDPISIQVAGYTLSLRLNEADAIFVEPIGESYATH